MYKILIFIAIALLIFLSSNNILKLKSFKSVNEIYQEKEHFIGHFQLAEWEFLKTRDPETNLLPPNIIARERQFVREIDNLYFAKANFLQEITWENLGPFNIAGRIKEIEFDILNENNLIVASASGGIWYSTNKGKFWFKSYQADYEQSVYCLEQDVREGKSNIWYCGTGELLSTTDRKISNKTRTIGLGDGIYKSTDNGISWYKLQSTNVYNHSNISEPFQMIWDIKIDKFNLKDDIVFAACFGNILRSIDGGLSWEISLGTESNTSFSTDIEITESRIFYAALSSYSPNETKPEVTGIWRSEDGINWIDITPKNFPDDTRIIKIKSSKSNPNILYVFTESPRISNDPFYNFATSLHTFWKYTYDPINKNGTWEDRTKNLPYQNNDDINQTLSNGINSLGGYCIDFAVSPDNENIVYIAGTNLFYSDNAFATKSFKKLGGYNSRLHPDIHNINFSPNNPDEIFIACDGGLFFTNNMLASPIDWIELNNHLVTSQIYSFGIPVNSNNMAIVAGLQDQGSVLTNNEFSNFTQILGGDGLSCFMSKNGEFALVSSYNSYVSGKVLSNNQVISSRKIVTEEIINKTNNFYTVFDVEPNDENELYLAVNNSIYRLDNLKEVLTNTNASLNWTEIKIPNLSYDSKISFIKVVANPYNTIYCGTSDGKVYKINNADTNPIVNDITSEDFPKNAFVSCIAIDDESSDNIFVTFSNYNIQSIFQSTDGGYTWIAQGGNLEENPDGTGAGPSIRWFEIVNNYNNKVYFVGTSSGVYSTNNLLGINTKWIKVSPDLIGNIKIDQIKYRTKDKSLFVATQGNGIYFANNLTNFDDDFYDFNKQITIYPNPTLNYVNIKINILQSSNYSLIVYNSLGKKINNFDYYFNKGLQNIQLDLSNYPVGVYFIKIINGEKLLINQKIIKK